MIRASILFAVAILTFPLVADADVIWEFNQSDGDQSLVATVTTDGSESDLLTDHYFHILSLDSLDYTGGPPPFDPAIFEPDPSAQVFWDVSSQIGICGISGSMPYYNGFYFGSQSGIQLSSNPSFWTQVNYGGILYNSLGPGYYTLATSPVPEPSTLALLTVGLLGIGGYASRRRRKLTH